VAAAAHRSKGEARVLEDRGAIRGHRRRVRDRIRHFAPVALGGLFLASGTLHLIRPAIFLPLIPRVLPAPELIVLGSGVAELVCGLGLLARRRWAGPASAALLVAILPGNLQMALDASADPTTDRVWLTVLWLRLPLQLPLIWAALAAAGREAAREP
jgi:uncharacterized membrane protein